MKDPERAACWGCQWGFKFSSALGEGFPRWLSGNESTCQCQSHRRCRFYPWAGKIPQEKEMATCSSTLAWRIPGTGEPGGLPSMELHRVGHDWSDLAAAAVFSFYNVLTCDITIEFDVRRPGFQSYVCHSWAWGRLSSCLTSQSLNFLMCGKETCEGIWLVAAQNQLVWSAACPTACLGSQKEKSKKDLLYIVYRTCAYGRRSFHFHSAVTDIFPFHRRENWDSEKLSSLIIEQQSCVSNKVFQSYDLSWSRPALTNMLLF